jgi:lipopolysaccharide export system protein LptC
MKAALPDGLRAGAPASVAKPAHRAVPPADLARRRLVVRAAKYALPVVALVLLSSIALWPEISRTLERGRTAWKQMGLAASNGAMRQPRYRGYDTQNQPYMVSADQADRRGPDSYTLTNPRGDITLRNGTWLQVQSKHGIYVQKADQLDLTQDVSLYRQDGTLLFSETATVDMKQGAVSSSDATHAEGPFGTLDAAGFTLLDKGGLVQFHGPAKLVLNAQK